MSKEIQLIGETLAEKILYDLRHMTIKEITKELDKARDEYNIYIGNK